MFNVKRTSENRELSPQRETSFLNRFKLVRRAQIVLERRIRTKVEHR